MIAILYLWMQLTLQQHTSLFLEIVFILSPSPWPWRHNSFLFATRYAHNYAGLNEGVYICLYNHTHPYFTAVYPPRWYLLVFVRWQSMAQKHSLRFLSWQQFVVFMYWEEFWKKWTRAETRYLIEKCLCCSDTDWSTSLQCVCPLCPIFSGQ